MTKIIVALFIIIILGGVGYYLVVRNHDPATPPGSTGTNVTTEQGGRLDLSSQNLRELPSNIFDNNSVTILDVSHNTLTGALPAEIRQLTNLEELDASDNLLTGIPAEIGQLRQLRIANFANNNISGLPLEIGNLTNLETLDLRGNPDVLERDLAQIRSKLPDAAILTD